MDFPAVPHEQKAGARPGEFGEVTEERGPLARRESALVNAIDEGFAHDDSIATGWDRGKGWLPRFVTCAGMASQ